ncbi:MAG: proton-conducting membrane transporter [Rikenellaceae bacterium]|nr:proton-conducting membrane transporter [Rikenellaceae bacterium]
MKQIVSLLALCVTALLSVWLVTETQKKSGVVDAIEARRSVRAYKDTPVEREKLQLLAECGVKAPSAMNRQEWELRIVDSKEWIDACTADYLKAVEGTDKAKYMHTPTFKNIFRNAPAVIFVAAPEGEFSDVNIGMLGENIMLAATELGLGTCCLGSVLFTFAEPEMGKYVESLNFSEGYRLRYALAVGYPDETPEAKARDLSKIKFVE